MLMLALRGVRIRWVTFVGSFVALALGVGLIAATGLALAATFDAPDREPGRFAAAPVVVRAADELRVRTATGVRTRPLARVGPVPPALVTRLGALGKTVEDRTFPVDVAAPGEGSEPRAGHPWSIAEAAPYRLTTGRPPAAPDEAVVTAGPGSRLRTGDRVRATTPAGTTTLTVVGIAADRGFEDALFLTDAEAARVSPAVDALVVHADATAVREVVAAAGGGMDVLTGDERRRADPGPDLDAEALVSVNALLGTAAGITLFVSVSVVASTFSFAVAQRRREFGLLRTAGATPGQIRRTVCAEAVVVGVLASAVGCLLGVAGAPLLAARLVDAGLAPPWFAIGEQSWPLHTAFWTGVAVATAGVLAASHRAGRTAPTEALREAAVDSRTMPVSRWLLAALALLTGAGLLVAALALDPGDVLGRKAYVTRPLLLIVGAALLAPVLVRPLARALTWLPARLLPGATGVLVRENTSAGVRRTAAVAAPVVITVALTVSLLGTVATLAEAKAVEVRTATTADLVVVPDAPGRTFPPRFVERVRETEGATVGVSRSTAVTVLEEGTALVTSEARAVEPARLAAVSAPPVVAGRLADLDDDGIVVNEEWLTTTVGERVTVWLGDGRKVSLRIAAVLATGTGSNGVYVTARNAGGAAADRIDVAAAEGADPGAVAAALRTAAVTEGAGVRVVSGAEWAAEAAPAPGGATRSGLWLILGTALLCTGLALANTLVTATSDRVRDLAVLRLAGATAPQVLRLVAVEAVVAVAVGAVIGLGVAAVNLAGVWGALALLGVRSWVLVPWGTAGAVVAVAVVLAAVSAVVPAAFALRTRPVELAGMRD
ncbi:FtsX-like permease family protein [Streptomyces sp. NPDC059452]|uniref:FtsX-like permease family protein n=1 Tax=Streptomyces sp. NPDC059452 TaxID=3346835 RepID=UPI0036B9E7A8